MPEPRKPPISFSPSTRSVHRGRPCRRWNGAPRPGSKETSKLLHRGHQEPRLPFWRRTDKWNRQTLLLSVFGEALNKKEFLFGLSPNDGPRRPIYAEG